MEGTVKLHEQVTQTPCDSPWLYLSEEKGKKPKLDLWMGRLGIGVQTETGQQRTALLLQNSGLRRFFQWVEV